MVHSPRIARRIRFIAVAGALSASQVAHAQDKVPRFVGRLVGVYDDRTGAPIDSAEVRDMVSGSSALTTSTGTLSLFFVDTAGSLIRFRKIGYKPLMIFVDNPPADVAPLTITLEPVAQSLPRMLTVAERVKYINPNLNAFEERRSHGLGHFIPEVTLRRDEHRTLGNVLRSYIPGIHITEGRLNSAYLPSCVDIYLDGALLGGNQIRPRGSRTGQDLAPSRGAENLNQFQVSEFAGVEFHGGATAPIEYSRTGYGCGVLLLWTRER